jgi:hypothetical protein
MFYATCSSEAANGGYRHRPLFALLVASAIARANGHYCPDLRDPGFLRWVMASASATSFDRMRPRG